LHPLRCVAATDADGLLYRRNPPCARRRARGPARRQRHLQPLQPAAALPAFSSTRCGAPARLISAWWARA